MVAGYSCAVLASCLPASGIASRPMSQTNEHTEFAGDGDRRDVLLLATRDDFSVTSAPARPRLDPRSASECRRDGAGSQDLHEPAVGSPRLPRQAVTVAVLGDASLEAAFLTRRVFGRRHVQPGNELAWVREARQITQLHEHARRASPVSAQHGRIESPVENLLAQHCLLAVALCPADP